MARRVVGWLVLFTLLVLASGCVFAYRAPQEASAATVARQPRGLPGHAEKVWSDAPSGEKRETALTSETFVRLSAQANPAVVNIFSQTNIETRFGDPLGLFTIRTPELDFQAKALGTGFLISPDGFLLTNAHVVAAADEIKIYLWRESEVRPARVIGWDPTADVALLKIEHSRPLPYLALADSDAVNIGEWVVAIGNPFGLEHSLTNGLISAKHRRIHEGQQGRLEDFLQTSAQINPGNSGGPLLNLRGEVVGVNTAVVAGGQGIGFAVPSNLVKEIVPHLVRAGRVLPARVGIEIAELTAELAASLGMSQPRGGVVREVRPGSPAETAGLRPNDVIVAVNGRPVYDSQALARTLSLLVADRPAALTVIRARREFQLTVTPAAAAGER